MNKKKIKIFTDGACSGNPGPAGIGFVIYDEDDNVIKECSEYLGEATNNIAEYTALIKALESIKDKKHYKLIIYSDSELLVKQIKGVYKVKNKNLKKLYDKVLELIQGVDFELIHIPREDNSYADKLAKKAIEDGYKSTTFK
ncbi:ribonuclease HI [Deferribacter desulfuricans SSM1]|uniref:Ribonuclease HI n=1 Tax=Deferribacter desulfuricans (strain DSM 14783 / JCM 11476 / NBRC 101012 / SSM1) TaxID=639282 RepID=D3PEC0_DEFDS|nr:ribonuclease HI family protein [Deferribacter desulfuricans]BAI80943.1 ribonuclease HI [Deferribacter desulfuricans SSM1]